MTYDYNSKIYLAKAVLNVKDLAGQTAFYTQIIGLEVLSQTEKEVILGSGNKPFLFMISFRQQVLRNECCAKGVLCHPRLDLVKRLSLGQLYNW